MIYIFFLLLNKNYIMNIHKRKTFIISNRRKYNTEKFEKRFYSPILEINKSLTLEENNIKNNAIISMKCWEKIKVNFISIDQKTKCFITCFDSDIFFDIEQQLYEIAPELQNEY